MNLIEGLIQILTEAPMSSEEKADSKELRDLLDRISKGSSLYAKNGRVYRNKFVPTKKDKELIAKYGIDENNID